MTTLERFKHYFIGAGLTNGFIIQDYVWVENKDSELEPYMVFQQQNGTGRINDLGGDDFFTLSLISGKGWIEPITKQAYKLLDYVSKNPHEHNINFIINTSGFVNPIQTEEGRFWIPLSFRCTS